MTRLKAFAIHALASALALFCVFAIVRWIWFPGPLFAAARGIDLLGIIIPVDVILGPLITLIIFNPAKKAMKELKRDIAMILLVQIGFMAYGIFAIFSARPVYIALSEKEFHLVTANQIEASYQKKAKDPQFLHFPLMGPQYIGVKQPEDKTLREDLSFTNAAFGLGAYNMPEYFLPFDVMQKELIAAALPIDKLVIASAEEKQQLRDYSKQHQATSLGFIRVYTPKKKVFAAIDQQAGKVVELIAF